MPAAGKRAQRAKGAAPYARPHTCSHCAAAFVTSSNLKRHVRTVHEKRRDYKCPHCAATFGQKGDLNKHVRTVHEKRRDHACPHCAATFGHAGNLKAHVRTVHEKRRDYKCPHCPAAFGQAHHRARHMHSKHPNDNAQAAECPICLEVLANVDEKATTPCGHVFCRACIEAALPRSGECPSCTQACSTAQLR